MAPPPQALFTSLLFLDTLLSFGSAGVLPQTITGTLRCPEHATPIPNTEIVLYCYSPNSAAGSPPVTAITSATGAYSLTPPINLQLGGRCVMQFEAPCKICKEPWSFLVTNQVTSLLGSYQILPLDEYKLSCDCSSVPPLSPIW